MKSRILTEEFLDVLDHDDPRALRSRAELRRLNALLGNFRWLRRSLERHKALSPDLPIVELGAGCGTFAKQLHRTHPDLHYTAIDIAPEPEDWPRNFRWRQEDIREALPDTSATVLIANLFVHHLSADQLIWLSGQLERFEIVILAEPGRRRIHHTLALALYPLGLSFVTRHDLHASIDSGFTGLELPEALGLLPPVWDVRVRQTLMGMYRLTASRT